MSELPDMISSVVGDNKIDAESHFKNTIAQKIGSALDLKRVEVANSLIKGQPNTSVENSADEEI
jgi:hypothetical protein